MEIQQPLDEGPLDEALERIHLSGPERDNWLSNHAPMAVESLAERGHGGTIHRWLDDYRDKLEEFPALHEPVTDDNWQEALGDPRRIADWTEYFAHRLAEQPWRDVLALWWPRLLDGLAGAATHTVIRVGHAVRSLLTQPQSAPRQAELAHALGYWAARHLPLGDPAPTPGAASAAEALATVPRIGEQAGGYLDRLAQIEHLPVWGSDVDDAEEARRRLGELVAAAVHRYATHGHGSPVMLVHSATAPNAVLRTLPALPRPLWLPSLRAAWAASAAVQAMYAPPAAAPYPSPGTVEPAEVFALARDHGDEHVIKFADTALDVGGTQALAAALRAVELTPRE
ncbi:questin oxidase family protein [Streptomyces xiaopingdaonensis]|uniref:questin oxidase family protein n=1 Tax=Streptomyces xiaopingdaonensis TaxID=1565415 RepID=UPI001872BFA1|nr:questin oxidase family protein [Streptomyces xiaopingdaonensis]